MSNNDETGPSDHAADVIQYDREHDYLKFLSNEQTEGLQGDLVIADDGTAADIDTDGTDTDGGAETGAEGTGAEGGNEKKKQKKQRT
jgi:hypothetical protein